MVEYNTLLHEIKLLQEIAVGLTHSDAFYSRLKTALFSRARVGSASE